MTGLHVQLCIHSLCMQKKEGTVLVTTRMAQKPTWRYFWPDTAIKYLYTGCPPDTKSYTTFSGPAETEFKHYYSHKWENAHFAPLYGHIYALGQHLCLHQHTGFCVGFIVFSFVSSNRVHWYFWMTLTFIPSENTYLAFFGY